MAIITAQEARSINELYKRCREAQCVSLLDSVMQSIGDKAQYEQPFVNIEGIGSGVDLNGFIAIVESLGYKVFSLPVPEYLPRSIKVSW